MNKMWILSLFLILSLSGFERSDDNDYSAYHRSIIETETYLSEQEFERALSNYKQLFQRYDFVFLRDLKIAVQLAIYLDQKTVALEWIRKGIAMGWELEDIEKMDSLGALQKEPEWELIEQAYDKLRDQYEERIDTGMREHVKEMFKKDQKKAMGALLRIGNKAQEKHAIKKFAPHSEMQISELIKMLSNKGYPGEKLIGNDYWMATILSHHNSITQEYVINDTLYNYIKPMLKKAIQKGEMSPYEYALVDDWQIAVSSGRTNPGYGFLMSPAHSSLSETNQLRQSIGLRTIELRNKLVEVETKTGMNFYLPDWVKGEITVK